MIIKEELKELKDALATSMNTLTNTPATSVSIVSASRCGKLMRYPQTGCCL